MSRQEAISYAQRVYRGQSTDLPQIARARRVQRALHGQGLKLRDAAIRIDNAHDRAAWADAVVTVCLRDAVSAWTKLGSDTPMRARVAAVERALAESGFDLGDVLIASRRYWERKGYYSAKFSRTSIWAGGGL